MALFSSFLGCFSKPSRVSDDVSATQTQQRRVVHEAEAKTKSKKSPPIPVTYFPVGTRLSLL